MDRTVYVSMLDTDWTRSLVPFTQRVVALQRLCAKQLPGGSNDPNPLHVVLAPEYTFRKNPAEVVRQAAKTYHGGNGRTDAASFLHFKESAERNTMFTKAERELLIFHLRAATRDRNVLVVPGTIFWEERAPTFRTTSVLRKQVVASRGIARNTCDVIYRGAVLHSYHKQIDSHEFDSFEENAYEFRQGVNAGTFDVSGLSVGVEICADHTGSSNLRSTLIERGNANMSKDERFVHNKLSTPTPGGAPVEFGLDLQLLVSDGMSFTPSSSAIRRGGFAAHCDTRLPNTVQSRNEQGAFAAVAPTGANFWSFNFGQAKTFRDAKAALLQNLKFPRR